MNTHETTAGSLAPAIRKNLPSRILRAVDNAMHVGALPRCVRPTFAELARFIPQAEPFATVFAKKETIALRINASVETVFRHLKALKALGLIETLDQERKSRNGRFAVSRVRLTQKGAGLLGLVEMLEDVCAVAVAGDAAEVRAIKLESPCPTSIPEQSGEAGKAVIHTPPHVKMTDGQTLTEPTFSKHQPAQRTENGLPVDLAWMTANGVSRAGIFCLMGMAKAKNKRLSDVITVVYQRIREMKGSSLFAYLAALCKGPTDFSAAAATERTRQRVVHDSAAFSRKELIFRERFAGVSLTNPAQTKLAVIDPRCAFAQVFEIGKVPTTIPLQDLRPMIEMVETGRLVLATLAQERRLAAF